MLTAAIHHHQYHNHDQRHVCSSRASELHVLSFFTNPTLFAKKVIGFNVAVCMSAVYTPCNNNRRGDEK